MTGAALAENAALLWIGAAVLFGLAELVVPGVFLIFLAVAAGLVGAALFALPGLPLLAQLGAFGVWSVVAVAIGRRWYVDYPVETSDPLLNDRARRMVGQQVVVTEAIVDGRGRVRIGDGEWPAAGPDAAAGARMRIVGVSGVVVEVEPV